MAHSRQKLRWARAALKNSVKCVKVCENHKMPKKIHKWVISMGKALLAVGKCKSKPQ